LIFYSWLPVYVLSCNVHNGGAQLYCVTGRTFSRLAFILGNVSSWRTLALLLVEIELLLDWTLIVFDCWMLWILCVKWK
jgi:hypothetical protein